MLIFDVADDRSDDGTALYQFFEIVGDIAHLALREDAELYLPIRA